MFAPRVLVLGLFTLANAQDIANLEKIGPVTSFIKN